MLLTPWFSFLHMAKCGGMFVRDVMVAQYGDQVTVGYHEPWHRLPDRDLPVLMFVRNPWDWYVSWFHYLRKLYAQGPPEIRDDDPVYVSGFGAGKNDFATTLRRACEGEISVSDPGFQAQISLHGDFYTAAFKYMAGQGLDDARLTIGRTERLREDLVDFVKRAGVAQYESLAAAIRRMPSTNLSERGDYRSYYSADTKTLVSKSSGWIIDRFGYTFDNGRIGRQEVVAERDRAIEERDALAEIRNQLQAELERLELELDAVRTARAATEAELTTARTEHAQLETARAATEAELATVRTENALLDNSIRCVERECAQLRSEIAAMTESKSWRYTAPMRRLYGSLAKRRTGRADS